MTNDDLRRELNAVLPALLAELRTRHSRRAAGRRRDLDAWMTMAVIVRHLTAQVVYPSVASIVDSEDVAQRVMLKLQSEAVVLRLTESTTPLAYLRGLARYATLDALRASRAQDISLTDLEIAEPTAEAQPESESPAVDRLREVLDGLPTSDRRLLELRFWRNLSIAEIAGRLREPPSRIAVRLFRLIERMRRAM